jgi:hypothetical protein
MISLHYPGFTFFAGASECPPESHTPSKVFTALEWLTAMCSHIPNRGEQMVRYYGYYNNVSRGKRQEAGTDDAVPCIIELQGDSKAFRKS